jgi:hypothetical protein
MGSLFVVFDHLALAPTMTLPILKTAIGQLAHFKILEITRAFRGTFKTHARYVILYAIPF